MFSNANYEQLFRDKSVGVITIKKVQLLLTVRSTDKKCANISADGNGYWPKGKTVDQMLCQIYNENGSVEDEFHFLVACQNVRNTRFTKVNEFKCLF